jgi:phage terminase large subunit
MSSHLAVADSKDEAMQAAKEKMLQRRERAVTKRLKKRLRLKQKCEEDAETRVMEREACANDPVRFINNWIWAYNPWNADTPLPTKMPFVLRPKQKEFVRWLGGLMDESENGLVEKSRKEGASYLCLAFGLHHWLFQQGFSMTVGSRKFELVEKKGDLDALIPKVRYMLYNLPEWFRPKGFSKNEHDNEARLLNPEKNTAITGEAGENMGRGGRSAFYLIDEWAFVQRQESVNAAVMDNAKVHVKLSTPSGSQDKMHEEKHSGRYEVFTLHWQDNPVKNYTAGVETESGVETIYPWYEEQKHQKDPVTVAQEVDIDYGAAAENVVIPSKWVRAAVEKNLGEGSVTTAGLDVADKGHDTILTIRRGPVVVRVEDVGGSGKIARVERLCREYGVETLYYDRMGVGAQITATLKEKEAELPFAVVGITNSDRPSSRKFRDRPEVYADERFKDYAAELWWALRLRFQATFEASEGKDHPETEQIALPERSSLISQLSQPTYAKTGSGKIKIDKMGQGGSSPDEAESLMYAFAEPSTADWSSLEAVDAMVA